MPEIIKNLDRTELERIVQNDTKFPLADIHKMTTAFFAALRNGVAISGYAEIHGLGSFKVKRHAPKKGKTPPKEGEQEGAPYEVGERVSVEFNAFEEFREEVGTVAGVECIP